MRDLKALFLVSPLQNAIIVRNLCHVVALDPNPHVVLAVVVATVVVATVVVAVAAVVALAAAVAAVETVVVVAIMTLGIGHGIRVVAVAVVVVVAVMVDPVADLNTSDRRPVTDRCSNPNNTFSKSSVSLSPIFSMMRYLRT